MLTSDRLDIQERDLVVTLLTGQPSAAILITNWPDFGDLCGGDTKFKIKPAALWG